MSIRPNFIAWYYHCHQHDIYHNGCHFNVPGGFVLSITQPCYELVYNTNEYSLGSYGGIVTPEVMIKRIMFGIVNSFL